LVAWFTAWESPLAATSRSGATSAGKAACLAGPKTESATARSATTPTSTGQLGARISRRVAMPRPRFDRISVRRSGQRSTWTPATSPSVKGGTAMATASQA
jgi:hypothetical protein